MTDIKPIDTSALIMLKGARRYLSAQQYRTLRGQVLAGDPDGAMKGLRKILRQKKNRTGKNSGPG